MKFEFYTLWVDDNRPFVESIEMELKEWLDNKKGCELKVLLHRDELGVIEDIATHDIDLIVIDYRLPRENGDVLIGKIRDSGCFQDIIFYSEGALPEKRFDGVFYVSKEDAKTRIKELTELKLMRSSDLATLRGWIVADAIELEYMLDEILMECFRPRHDIFAVEILNRTGTLDFSKKQQIINSLLTQELSRLVGIKDVTERHKKLQRCKGIFKSFEAEIIYYRNSVAHGKFETTPDGVKRLRKLGKKSDYFDFDENGIAQGRKNLRKHRDCLIELRQLLITPEE